MELDFKDSKNIYHKPDIEFKGKDKDHKDHHKREGYMKKTLEYFCGTVDYKGHDKKSHHTGFFELTDHAEVRARKKAGLVDKQEKKDKKKIHKEKKKWKAKMAKARAKAHENFSDSDESSEELEDSSSDSDDEENLPYLEEYLEKAQKKFNQINDANSSLEIPHLQEKKNIGPIGNNLLDCEIKGYNWNPHSKGPVAKYKENFPQNSVGAFMQYQETHHMLGPDIDNKNVDQQMFHHSHPRMIHLMKTLERITHKKCPKKAIKKLRKMSVKRCGIMYRGSMCKPFMISAREDLHEMQAFGPLPYAVTGLLWRLNEIGKAKLMQYNELESGLEDDQYN